MSRRDIARSLETYDMNICPNPDDIYAYPKGYLACILDVWWRGGTVTILTGMTAGACNLAMHTMHTIMSVTHPNSKLCMT